MIRTLLPWATSAGTLLGMWLVGQKRSIGWTVGLVNQVLWVTFAIMFEAWGLLPLTIALIVIYTKALLAWRRDERSLREASWLITDSAPVPLRCDRQPCVRLGECIGHLEASS